MPVKRALLIGIDAYQKIRPLQGCVNDVDLMAQVLNENCRFPKKNIRVLKNERATRKRILAAFDAFAESVGLDDQVVVHFAGHGSQMTDREADEPSGYDSTIMPVDSEGWQGDNRDITDDEISLRLVEPIAEKTSFITFIFDCCHSGTITRDDFGVNSRSMPADKRPIEELPPSPIPLEKRTGAREAGPSGWMPLAEKYVLISGCRDEELSYEYRPPEGNGEITHGALTYFLSREIRQAGSGSTYRDIFERAAANVTGANEKQHPQMEGRADRAIFGVRDLKPMRFVRVTERKGKKVTLGAGAALGLTVGSVYAVYPQGTKNTESGEPLGGLEVTAVRGVTSDAKINSEADDGAITVDCRAFETVHSYGDLRLRVQVASATGSEDDAAPMRKAVDDSPLLELVGEEEAAAAAVRVYLLGPRGEPGPDDPVRQLGEVTEPTWAGVKEDGQIVMPPKPVDAVSDVIRNLETLARYRQALALDNPDPNSKLRGQFELVLLRRTAEGKWTPAKPDAESGQIIYEEGEPIAFRVVSHQDRKKVTDHPFVSLVDFGLAGAVSLIHPAPGAQEKMLPGGFFEVGTQDDAFELVLPDKFPFDRSPARGGLTAGTETVKLFVTSGGTDFSFLEQGGMRSAAATPSPLQMLFETATQGSETREIRRRPVKQEDWTTVVKPFVLRRKQSRPLNADGAPLWLGGTVITAPGLEGDVSQHAWGSDRAEAVELPSDDLTGALAGADVAVRQTIEVSNTREVGPATRSAHGQPALELSIRDPGPDHGQMLLTTDEQGVITWHFAPQPEPAPSDSRSDSPVGQVRRYVIPRSVPAAGPAPGQRGLIGAAGRKLLKELVFPLVDPLLGAIGESFAASWEAVNRPYRVRRFSPECYDRNETAPFTADDWQRLAGGRALLMVHGTFSRAHSAFGSMPKEFVEELHRHYEGRVFALDHFTLSHGPRKNVNWFFEQIPEEIALDVDIICHSRGGLVSRVLSERLGELNVASRDLKVGKIIFAGSPNTGTILADADRMGDMIDTFTNVLNFIPDAGLSDTIAGVVTVAKQLAVGAMGGLKGLQSMRPEGGFAKWLNTGPRGSETRYFALTSDYSPAEPGLRDFAKNRLMDRVFKGPNDLVVPTNGVFEENGSGFFPIEDKVVFSGEDGVAHTGFFGNRAARARIMEWLSA